MKDSPTINYNRVIPSSSLDRFRWVEYQIKKCKVGKILDVGAGEMPFKNLAVKLGFDYRSHDFEKYSGNSESPGLQNKDWLNSGHDLVCDIMEIPEDSYELIIITEVLEHVPDPAAAMAKISKLLAPDGKILITVPFSSRMHQSPFWFSSGLSPFWFFHHAKLNELEVSDCILLGNFYDVMIQEVKLFFGPMGYWKINLGEFTTYFLRKLRKILEPRISTALLDSGSLAVFVLLQNDSSSAS